MAVRYPVVVTPFKRGFVLVVTLLQVSIISLICLNAMQAFVVSTKTSENYLLYLKEQSGLLLRKHRRVTNVSSGREL